MREIHSIKHKKTGIVYGIADDVAREQLSEKERRLRTEHNNDIVGLQNDIEAINSAMERLESSASEAVYAWRLENNVLYLLDQEGNVIGEGGITGIGGGGGSGGGSGGGNNASMNATNKSGWISKSVAEDTDCIATINWSSVEDEISTGPGTVRVDVEGVPVLSQKVQQGDWSYNLKKHLNLGLNNIQITVSDIYDNKRVIKLKVTVVSLDLSSTFDPRTPYTEAIEYRFTPVGAVRKMMHFLLDNQEIDSFVVADSGETQIFMIPMQAHGTHSFEVYFDCVIDSSLTESKHLKYEIMFMDGNQPLIASTFDTTEVRQYETIEIPYIVYTPNSLMSEVVISVNGQEADSLTVGRTENTFTYRCDSIGSLSIVIRTGSVTRTFSLTVSESQYQISAVTSNLSLYLSATGRSNNAANKTEWKSGDVHAQLFGFNYTSDGWLNVDGSTVLRVTGDARVYIPFEPFKANFRNSGKTIEIEFATRDVLNYDSIILSCFAGGRGLRMTSQSINLKAKVSDVAMQFKENEHVRVSFVVEKASETRLIIPYINGVASGAIQYPDNEEFQQTESVGISIGSNDATIDIYCIRVYDTDLNRRQMVTNRIADIQDVDEMLTEYLRNDIYDENGKVVIDKLPKDLPYMIITCPILPQFKGDKKKCSGSFVDPVNENRSFTWTSADIDVQGTSSQYYARKNYKIKFKKAVITLADGTETTKYAIREGAMPVSTFCFKADVASSEGCNNVELVRLYDMSCPYKTPAQEENESVHQGIDGFPMVIFHNNGAVTSFLGKYNFNVDKGAEEFFGFGEGDESWEIKNNTSDRVLWKSADYDAMGVDDDGHGIKAWLLDFEARYPDTDPEYTDPSQLREFSSWIVTTNPDTATNAPLPAPVIYSTTVSQHIATEDPDTGAISYREVLVPQDVTFTMDSAEYRLAKFKAELGDYMEVEDAKFYYLFTELFLMIDSRAKNMFPSFVGTAIGEEVNE